ncbi:MAG: hypothetical protein JST40_08885 [Armatimonadetes bacterium]|nr:hypothetical protein [Armatimonadota bacterium]
MLVPLILFSSTALNPIGIPVDGGFLQTTEAGSLARFQYSYDPQADFQELFARAQSQAGKRPPRIIKVLQVIVPDIEAEVVQADGKKEKAQSSMSRGEQELCRRYFQGYQSLVFANTNGAARIQPFEMVLKKPVKNLDPMGNGAYWLSAPTALAGVEKAIRENFFDSICVYYKKPDNVKAGLLGGAIGRDYGVRGSAFWTQWVHDWKAPVGPLNPNAIVSLHEWLHNVSYYTHQVMGFTAVPDCHAAEEHGYWSRDGGYPQWQAWNRDLVGKLIPSEVWYRFDTRSPERAPSSPAKGEEIAPGKFYSWQQVSGEWMSKLPKLTDKGLAQMTGITDLELKLEQFSDQAVCLRLTTSSVVASTYSTQGLESLPVRLDNVLAMKRLSKEPELDDPRGGYGSAPIESIAWIRPKGAAGEAPDLVLVRTDIAGPVMRLLDTVGRPADRSVIGYIHRTEPKTNEQVTLIALKVRLANPNSPTEVGLLKLGKKS